MTFQISMLLHADGDQAAAEVRKVGTAARETGAAAEQLDRKGREAAGGVKTLGGVAGVADAKLDQLSVAERRAAQSAVAMGNSHRLAAGQVGNLTAQFNDIGMMLAAGQNPLQLALQQGTQITQVIGPMGAGGAVRALGAAFMSLLSPINLVTIGGIAAGAAMTQWLFEAGEEAETLEDKLDRLDEAMSALQSAQKDADTPFRDMIEVYGQRAEEARALLRIEQQIAEVQAKRAFAKASLASADALGASSIAPDATRESIEQVADMVETEKLLYDLRSERIEQLKALGRARTEAETLELRQLRELRGQSIYAKLQNEELIQSVQDLQKTLDITEESAFAVAAAMADVQAAETTVEQARAAAVLADEIFKATDGLKAADDETIQLYLSLLEAAQEGQKLAGLDLKSGITPAADEAARLAENLGISLAAAVSLINLQNSKQYSGRGSDPRRWQDGGSSSDYENQLGYKSVEQLIEELTRSSRRGGGGARAQRDAVTDLIQELERQLALLRETDTVQQALIENRKVLAEATDAERRMIEELIVAQEREKVAAAAAAEQKQFFLDTSYDAIELLAARGGSLADMWDMVAASLARAALQASLLGTGPLANLFGTAGGGGLLEIFAGAIGLAEGGAVPDDQVVAVSSGEFRVPREVARKHMPLLEAINANREAAAGLITGPGGGTSDDILMRAQEGDYIVNARATSRHRSLLEAMVAGSSVQALATGGPVGGTRPVPPPPVAPAGSAGARASDPSGGRMSMDVRILPSPEFDVRIERKSQDVATEVVRQYDRYVAPGTARDAVRDHRRDG